MTNGKCLYHKQVETEIKNIKEQKARCRASLDQVNKDQWDRISEHNRDHNREIGECMRTKTCLKIGGLVAIVLMALFGAVWSEIAGVRNSTGRIERQLIILSTDIIEHDERGNRRDKD